VDIDQEMVLGRALNRFRDPGVVGDKPGDLLERNYLMLDLNPPGALADTSWIKPGKVMRDTTLTTANAKAIAT
jgi:hypothetical protein